MRHSIVRLGAVALFVFVATRPVGAQEQAVPVDKIPKAVMNALLAKFPKAKIDKCTKAKAVCPHGRIARLCLGTHCLRGSAACIGEWREERARRRRPARGRQRGEGARSLRQLRSI